ncbi:MAG: hypothetical protein A2W25_10630 [candidate division Zixibacteria bacterium RBG_16_53_22]|nr:MAG: hypothetical protein A2W25_10630 [candidate division Zixibacteria bacterium RBG_16_53_22]
MNNRIKFLAAAGLVLSIAMIFAGCSTEDPWSPTETVELSLTLISGPANSDTVTLGYIISYSWAASGGSGQVQYQYRLDALNWSALSRNTFATLEGLSEGAHAFSVRAQDAGGASDETSADFFVMAHAATPDTDIPSVTITASPPESSFVATGSTISFTWEGADVTAGDNLLYRYFFAADTSEWSPGRTVTFSNVAAADPASFVVWAMDPSGNISDPDAITFIVKNATILYVDDYQWLDPFQNVDMVKEREQQAFYRAALEGYAFAEWEVATQGMPDSSFITNFSTVVFASDSHLGDASDTWWTYVGDAGGGVMRHYMESGGHLIAAGANILQWIYNTNPPQIGDFEFDWLGIDSTAGWDFWDDFTWAVNAGNVAQLPDSMKIDVGKNGDQIDYAEDIFAFREGATALYVKGLDIDGGEPADYGESVGHIYAPGGVVARSAMLNFDAFSMPLDDIRTTFRYILTEFGE